MRQIFADCIFPVTSAPVANGILRLTDNAEVIDILNPDDDAYDISAAEIHEGWLIPGMVNAHCHLELSHLPYLRKRLVTFLRFLLLQRVSKYLQQVVAVV